MGTLLGTALCLLFARTVCASDWAVEVRPDVEADSLAEQLGMVNAGEAVPGSNIYHFK